MSCTPDEPLQGQALLDKIRHDFLGLTTYYPTAYGSLRPRRYLDSAASALMMRSAHDVANQFLDHYGNSHSQLHYGARIATQAVAWAKLQVLRFVGASRKRYACIFTGSGTTAAVNQAARILCTSRPERDTVLVSGMEHHSNDLPHRLHAKRVLHVPLVGSSPRLGQVDLNALQKMLVENLNRVNYVAVSAASNVTGILNPVHDVALLAHRHGAYALIDAAQMIGHVPFIVPHPHPLDIVVFSGHKVYAPGSPGVIIASRALLARAKPDCIGGGVVKDVDLSHYTMVDDAAETYEPGTPDIVGAVSLGAVLKVLERIGIDRIYEETSTLVEVALTKLQRLGAIVYGETMGSRTGVISFNLPGADHALVTAALNDYHNIAVRNECFCAQPYVRALLNAPEGQVGMVRASFGLYNTLADVNALAEALADISLHLPTLRTQYVQDDAGHLRHARAFLPSRALFDPDAVLLKALAR